MNPFIAKDDGKYVLFSITFAVVPYVGTWIEIILEDAVRAKIESFPTWERG